MSLIATASWFEKFAKTVIAYFMAFVNVFGVLKARGS